MEWIHNRLERKGGGVSEALWGVVIGGIIASTAPAFSMWMESRRWRRERMLETLRSQRRELERLITERLPVVHAAMKVKSYSPDVVVDLLVLMPPGVKDAFLTWVAEEKNAMDPLATLDVIQVIGVELKDAISSIDKRIDELLR